ncbi:MAG: PIN domain-containing protein [Gammaproteobacteria bacterium]|nr:PIN domain-containing protein [Gammaproteobacteria bacterium]
MKYLLDTCTISHFTKGHLTIGQHLKQTPPNFLAVSTTTLMEIEYGLKLNPARAEQINLVIETLLAHITILPFEARDAKIAGSLRAELKKLGAPIGPYDLIIASQAVSHGLILVTQNTKEFERVPALILEDWLY